MIVSSTLSLKGISNQESTTQLAFDMHFCVNINHFSTCRNILILPQTSLGFVKSFQHRRTWQDHSPKFQLCLHV
jgi:hypothetical protein